MNQTALAQLQDEQRFAMTVITDAVQSGGYFADPTTDTAASLPATRRPSRSAGCLPAATPSGRPITSRRTPSPRASGPRWATARFSATAPTPRSSAPGLRDSVLAERGDLGADVHGDRWPERRRARAARFGRAGHGHLLRRQARLRDRRLQRRHLCDLGQDVHAQRRERLHQRECGAHRAHLRQPAVSSAEPAANDHDGARHRSDEPRGAYTHDPHSPDTPRATRRGARHEPAAAGHHHDPRAEHVPQLRHAGEDRRQPARERARAACRQQRAAVRGVVAAAEQQYGRRRHRVHRRRSRRPRPWARSATRRRSRPAGTRRRRPCGPLR